MYYNKKGDIVQVGLNGTDKKRGIVMADEKIAGLRRHSEEINRLVNESLRGALVILLKDTEYDKITISGICLKAGVSRMAFYGNYKTKDDLLEAIVEDLNKTIYAEIGSPFLVETTINWYRNFFRLIYEKRELISRIFDAGFRKKYFFFVNKIILNTPMISSAEKYRRLIWSGGIENVIVYWFENGMTETPDRLAEFCNGHLYT